MTLLHVEPRQWSKDEYHRMVELGILGPQDRVELIEGVVVPLSPHNPSHSHSVSRATMVLTRTYGASHTVRVQLPLDVGAASEPEPDFALILHDLLSLERHPDQADLVIEVANTSLAYDRVEKGSLYARAGIQDYWVVNLRDRVLEIYREPGPDPDAPAGSAYRHRTTLEPEARVKPLSIAGPEIVVADLF